MSGLRVITDMDELSNRPESPGSTFSSPHRDESRSNNSINIKNILETSRNTNEYFLNKIIGKKEHSRRVITGMHPYMGKFIQIDSKLNCCFPAMRSKEKNRIYINFDENVVSKVENTYGTKSNIVIKIRRSPPHEDYVLLTSENDA